MTPPTVQNPETTSQVQLSRRADNTGEVYFLTRQRISGADSGSTRYLLNIAGAIARSGRKVHLVSCSTAMFGRKPFYKLKPEMSVFTSISIRGGARVGRWVINFDPFVFFSAVLYVFDRIGMKAKLWKRPLTKPAPYSVVVPMTKADQNFLDRTVKGASTLIADYCFLTETFAATQSPHAQTMVLMHDSFSGRWEQFQNQKTQEVTIAISPEEEVARLAQANVIIAIQKDEAARTEALLAGRSEVITVPMVIDAVTNPAPGEDGTVLFVGSSAPPNVDGLSWFLESVWPLVRQAKPAARISVAGTVGTKMPASGPGVTYLGVVDDLSPLYERAGVVISPLRLGSGLKIKLVEAAGYGKAIVATSITLQGVEAGMSDKVWVADEPKAFADGIIAFLDNIKLREDYGRKSLEAARAQFSGEHIYADLISRIK